MNILLVGGLDTSGQSGLARDLTIAAKMGLHGCPIATCITANDELIQVTDSDTLEAALEAAWTARSPQWMKVGVVVSREQASAIADFALRRSIGMVHDPVLQASSGHVFASPDNVVPLLKAATFVTPNQKEADILKLVEGPKVHVTLGGKLAGNHRGTGCRFATRVACLLAHGFDSRSAIEESHLELEHELAGDAAEQALAMDSPRLQHLRECQQGLHVLLRVLRFENIPEVGMNFAYALQGATDARKDVAGLAGRITIAGFHRDWTGRVAFGGPHHTGRIAIVLQEYNSAARCVVNHRFDHEFIRFGRAAGLSDSEFRRVDEPDDTASTMEWGFRSAIERHGGVPDLVWDRGGDNKEAMIRVIGRNPADVARKIALMQAPNQGSIAG